ncbi:MAG: MFS transporter [Ruminococcaceae bacterium]|nr:MFS transporter [Oscillospiraceae bacterium]
MRIRTSYQHTILAAYGGYITQAIINNFLPLLLLTFQSTWDIPLSKLTLLISVNFGVQLTVDLICAKIVDKIGYRPCIVTAHILAAIGLAGLGILPFLFPDPYVGILLSIVIYAIGGGITEVLISPIVEACPSDNKESAMELLHSFYCWGHVFVILASTAFFVLAGIEHWRILACLWALFPLCNAVYFSLVPICQLNDSIDGEQLPIRKLFRLPVFWLFVILMLCAGASEQAMSQWASAFAEAGLGVSKTVGDLAGPCMFAILMGLSRLISSRLTLKYDQSKLMVGSCTLCVAAYLLAALSPWPILSLVGCGLCGLSVGIMWPGTFSLAAVACRGGGTALFAFLALAGDLGCMSGPAVVGFLSEGFGGDMKIALLFAITFPALLGVGLLLHLHNTKKNSDK